MNTTLKQVLTIAGSDSGGGAGIQADIKAMSANGVFAMSVITAVTAQNTEEVTEVFELPTSIIAAQIDAVRVDSGVYYGRIELSIHEGKLLVINRLPLETYLLGIVGSEMNPSWPIEALKAQAVAARTLRG